MEGIHWKSIPILRDLSNLTPILRVPQFPHFSLKKDPFPSLFDTHIRAGFLTSQPPGILLHVDLALLCYLVYHVFQKYNEELCMFVSSIKNISTVSIEELRWRYEMFLKVLVHANNCFKLYSGFHVSYYIIMFCFYYISAQLIQAFPCTHSYLHSIWR